MNIIVFANQKGGVGKTTILVHMAFFLSEFKNRRVAVLDLDHQGNATFSLNDFAFPKTAFQVLNEPDSMIANNINLGRICLLPADPELLNFEKDVQIFQKLKKLMETLENLGINDVLVDTTPALNNRLAASLMVATTVVTPIELEVYSLQGVSLMLQTISNISGANKNLKFLGMLPSRVDSRNPRQKGHMEQLRLKHPELIIPFPISARSSIADAVALKVPVWKIKKTSARPAAKEIKAFGEFLYNSFGEKNDN